MFDIAQVDTNLPGIASPGLIVGLVQQIVPAVPGKSEQTTQPYIDHVMVSLDSDPSQVAVYDPQCSTFTIFDPRLGGGTRTITATAPAVAADGSTQRTTVLHATVAEVNGIQVDDQTYAIYAGLENQYRNIGRVTLTFPPTTPPPPPPQIDVRFYTLDDSNFRLPVTGIVFAGSKLVIALKSALTVTGASIGDTQLSIVADSLDNPKDTQPALDFRAQDPSSGDTFQRYTVGPPGSYTLTVTAASGGPPVTVTKSFLVVAPGATNNQVTLGQAPIVISNTPLQGVDSVPLSTFPQIVFSEPVANIPANFSFVDAGNNSPSVLLIGVRPDGSIASPVGAGDFITSLTVQPLAGLKFNEKYTLTLNNGIIDQNQDSSGNPLHLATFVLIFTTFGPQKLDSNTDQFSSTRPVVIGQRVYVGKVANAALSAIDVVDITDPALPLDFGTSNFFAGHVVDASGLASSPVTRCLTEVLPGQACPQQGSGGPLLAMAATLGATDSSMPSNIWLYDLSNPDRPARVGALSATTSATQDGTLLRIFMKDQFIFASTFRKGLQMIDLQQAVNEFQQTSPLDFGQAITTEGNGFALDSVVNTIPIPITVPSGTGVIAAPALMMDVKAADYATAAPDPNNPSAPVPTQTMIVATGRLPFVVADPQQGGLSAVVYPPLDSTGNALSQQPWQSSDAQFQLQQGRAVALGSIPITDSGNTLNQPIAVLVGTGTANNAAGIPLLAVVDMTNPRTPAAESFLILKDQHNNLVQPIDVVLKDNLALIGTDANMVLLVNLTDPARPLAAGEVDGVFGDRLALAQGGILVTSSWNSVLGGIHTAVFDPALIPNQTTDSDLSVGYQFRPEGVDSSKLNSATINIILKSSDDLKLTSTVQQQNFKSPLALSAAQLKELADYAQAQIRTNHEFTLYFPKVAGFRNVYEVELDIPGADIGPITPANVVVEVGQPDLLAREDAVARTFAPVFIQPVNTDRKDTTTGEVFEDYFLRMDFDGDFNLWNNSDHLNNAQLQPGYDLGAYVHSGVQETEFYYFVHYAYYHGKDPKHYGKHANDMEGGMIVVQKSDARKGTAQEAQATIPGAPAPLKPNYDVTGKLGLGKVTMVMLLAHDVYDPRTQNLTMATSEGSTDPPAAGSPDMRIHPVIVSTVGEMGGIFHVLDFFGMGHGARYPDQISGTFTKPRIIYVPGGSANTAETPPLGTTNPTVHYRLISFTADRVGALSTETLNDSSVAPSLVGLWDHRRDNRIFGHASNMTLINSSTVTFGHSLEGRNGCKANLPWGWHGSVLGGVPVPVGERFIDPEGQVMRPKQNTFAFENGVKEPDARRYVSNIYLKDNILSKTAASPPPTFTCSCTAMKNNFSNATGLNPLPLGDGCNDQ